MRRFIWAAASCGVFTAVLAVATQTPALSVASALPVGELAEVSDARDVRVVFSEPMIALGASVTSPPRWFSIEPAVRGSFHWSGTTTLIFTPQAPTLPNATTFTVTIDAAATSVAGRRLSAPYRFTFATPTVRILSAEWYRKTGRYDSAAVIALRFNQRVRPQDVMNHVTFRLTPHDWSKPALSAAARERIGRTDPDGPRLFDAKVAAVDRVASSSAAIDVRLASHWNLQRFPSRDDVVVIETSSPVLPESWITIGVDGRLPSLEGPLTHAPHSTVLKLERPFFVSTNVCAVDGCDPDSWHPLNVWRPTLAARVQAAVTITDVSDVADERSVGLVPGSAVVLSTYPSVAYTPAQLGFPTQPPNRTWAFHVSPTLQADDGQVLGFPWVGFVANGHAQATLGLAGGVWESAWGTDVPFLSRNLIDVSTWMQGVSGDEVVPTWRLLNGLVNGPRAMPQPPPLVPLSQILMPTTDALEWHGLPLANVLSPRGTGVVWAAVRALNVGTAAPRRANDGLFNPRVALVQVTNLGLTVKDAPDSTLVFVTRLDNAEPVSGAVVTLRRVDNSVAWQGPTNADGVAQAPMGLRSPDRPWELAFVVTAEKDGDLAFVNSDWNDWAAMGAERTGANPALRGAVFTDRGIYRLDEDVHVKAIVRQARAQDAALFDAGTAFDLTVIDQDGREIDRRGISVNRWSAVDSVWHIPPGAPLGYYRMQIAESGLPKDSNTNRHHMVSTSFQVAAYRPPDFRVDAHIDPASPIAGATLHASAQAKYLFGGSLGPQPVRWRAYASPGRGVTPAIEKRFPSTEFAFGYSPQRVQVREVGGKPTRLDASGHLVVDLPTKTGDDFATWYSFESDVEGLSRQHIAGRHSLLVHPAALAIGVKGPRGFVNAASGTSVDVVAVDLDGQPRAGVAIRLALVRQDWEFRPGSYGYPEWQLRDTPAGEWNVTSEAELKTVRLVIPSGGSYSLRASARDGHGKPTRTDVSFFATGSAGLTRWQSNGNRLELVPEKLECVVGDTARILIQSPWEHATALMTVEREGVRSYRRFEVNSTQDTIDVPLTAADVPNVIVSVALLKGRTSKTVTDDGSDPGAPAWRIGHVSVTVRDPERRLKVRVESDRQEYRPHDRADVSVAVTNAHGQPVAGEVTLWAVDYAQLSLTGYATPDALASVYAHRPLQVYVAENRLRLIHPTTAQAAGASESIHVTAQTQLVETALSHVQRSSTVMGLPPSALAITLDGVNVLDQYLKDSSGSSMFQATKNALNFVTFLPDTNIPIADLRTDFRPVAFWIGSLETDADGRARTSVTLPDSLTTYRIMAVAGDAQSRFGSADHEISAAKSLTLLPSLPRFLTKGDQALLGATLTNNSHTPGDAVVQIRTADPATLALDAVTRRTIHLAAGASVPIRFSARAMTTGLATIQMTVEMNGASDAFAMPLPVTIPVHLTTVAAYGDTTTRASERVSLPADAQPGVGGLQIDLSSSALVGLGETARYLDEYPYECAEQMASRALARLLAADLDDAFGANVSASDRRAKAESAIQRLNDYQCGDGGFALWPGMCQWTSPYLTAYVLHVIQTARTLKVPINEDRLARGLGYLAQQRTPTPTDVRDVPGWGLSQAFAGKVLAEGGWSQGVEWRKLIPLAERLPVAALSYLADALAASKDRGSSYQDVVRRLTNAIHTDGGRAHVEEVDEDGLNWLWNTNARSTAVVLDGLSRRGDSTPLGSPLVRWLLEARKNGRWGTTHENAAALEALVAYYRAFESEPPQMSVGISLGDLTLQRTSFAGRSTTAKQIRVTMADLAKQLSAGDANLAIDREGTGRLYYTTRLQYAAPASPDSIERGIRIARRYEKTAANGAAVPAQASVIFKPGDLIRVTLSVTLASEGRYLAMTDRLPAGVEAVDGTLQTTATDIARVSTTTSNDGNWRAWWRRGGFDHVEKHDDHVLAFATRLGSGTHEFSYLVRATTAGSFSAAGARIEAMYAPDVMGQSAASVIRIR